MRPLRLVNPKDLQLGKMYLIQEKRPEYAHLNCKGVFVKNDYPNYSYQCTISHFTNIVITGNTPIGGELSLQDVYWNYYEADAVERAYITKALRVITGDSDFIFESY
jgi:hypothetical protein